MLLEWDGFLLLEWSKWGMSFLPKALGPNYPTIGN
jgi:hypothetical protein